MQAVFPPTRIIAGPTILALARHWWMLALRGLVAVVFGASLILFPGITLIWMVLLFGCYLAADGVLALLFALIAAFRHERFAALIAEAVLDLACAGLALTWPDVTIIVAVYLAAWWAVLSGFALLMASPYFGNARWFVTLAATVSMLLGVLLLFAPIHGAVAMAVAVGCYALLFGAAVMAVAWQLRRLVPAP
jgi:uncharacterized membrane protein HdeD (DUF308 family)